MYNYTGKLNKKFLKHYNFGRVSYPLYILVVLNIQVITDSRKDVGFAFRSKLLVNLINLKKMSIRFPDVTVLDFTDTGVGATSVVSQTFTLPQDTDNVLMKVVSASVAGTAQTVDVYLQTSDDGGSTYYDIGRARLPDSVAASVISFANASAQWINAPVTGSNVRQTSIIGNASVRGTAVNTQTGLPVLGQIGRVQVAYGGVLAANAGVRVQVSVNQQSATA